MVEIYELRQKNNIYKSSEYPDLVKPDIVEVLAVLESSIDCLMIPELYEVNAPWNNIEPIPLTKEILKNNLGFEAHDMGDFWQFEKHDFILIQVKLSIGQMPYMFVLKSSLAGSVNFYHVHHLQNTYLDLKGELLEWQK